MEIKHINLDEYGRKIFLAKDSPGMMDNINIELSGFYAYYNEQLNYLELAQAKFWGDNKDLEGKPRSDKSLEMLWKLTKDGEDHMRVTRAVKTIEKLSSNLKASLRRAETEARNIN